MPYWSGDSRLRGNDAKWKGRMTKYGSRHPPPRRERRHNILQRQHLERTVGPVVLPADDDVAFIRVMAVIEKRA